jgi:hypothetical protein
MVTWFAEFVETVSSVDVSSGQFAVVVNVDEGKPMVKWS